MAVLPQNAYGETITSTISSAFIQNVDCGLGTATVSIEGKQTTYPIALHECLKITEDAAFYEASKCGQLAGDVGLQQSGMLMWATYKIVHLSRLHVVQQACI